jgi:cytochrome P450
VNDRLPFVRTGEGDYRLDLSNEERDVLRSLPTQLRQLLADDDPALIRLFPTAYSEDPEREEEYRRLMKEELLARRLESLTVVEETVDADRLSEEQLNVWMRVINDLRLVLGTILDVSEDEDPEELDADDPRAPMRGLYWYLSMLLQAAIEALDDA